MEKNNPKGWLYLLPAMLFLGVFMVYPLIDVLIYSFEEGYNSASHSGYIQMQKLSKAEIVQLVQDNNIPEIFITKSFF